MAKCSTLKVWGGEGGLGNMLVHCRSKQQSHFHLRSETSINISLRTCRYGAAVIRPPTLGESGAVSSPCRPLPAPP